MKRMWSATLIAFALISSAAVAEVDWSGFYSPGKAITKLSEKAARVGKGKEWTRKEAIRLLGLPTWVLLPGDKSEFEPESANFVDLYWDNGKCAPVGLTIDIGTRGQMVVGIDEGRGLCYKNGPYPMGPKRGKFSCKEKKRAAYCR